MGKAWVNIIKYILPVFLSILLVFGVMRLFEVTPTSGWIIRIILLLLIIIVPLVLTILPSKWE